jgi:hypothetical protein
MQRSAAIVTLALTLAGCAGHKPLTVTKFETVEVKVPVVVACPAGKDILRTVGPDFPADAPGMTIYEVARHARIRIIELRREVDLLRDALNACGVE